MYKILTKRPGQPAHEQHVHTHALMVATLGDLVSRAVHNNLGFVFLEDVGASQPCIRYSDGVVVEVVKTERKQ